MGYASPGASLPSPLTHRRRSTRRGRRRAWCLAHPACRLTHNPYHSTSVQISGRGASPTSTAANRLAASSGGHRGVTLAVRVQQVGHVGVQAATRCWSPSSRPSSRASAAAVTSASGPRPVSASNRARLFSAATAAPSSQAPGLGQAVPQVALRRRGIPARATSMPSTLSACAVAPGSAAAWALASAARPRSAAWSAHRAGRRRRPGPLRPGQPARFGALDQLCHHRQVRIGQVPVAQPVMHVGELVLDRGLRRPVALAAASNGRGRLELGQRLPVPAERDQHLAQGDPAGQLRVAQREGLVRWACASACAYSSRATSAARHHHCAASASRPGQLQVVGHGRGPGGGRIALMPAGQGVGRASVHSGRRARVADS